MMLRVCLPVLLLSFTSVQPGLAGVHRWTALGPYGGEVTALAVDPLTSSVWAGTGGGRISPGCLEVCRNRWKGKRPAEKDDTRVRSLG